MKQGLFVTLLRMVCISIMLLQTAFAGIPVWSIVPASGSNPRMAIPANQSAEVTYIITNNSHKYHQLAMLQMNGVINTPAFCYLTPRGTAGSSCSMLLIITASSIGSTIAGGPVLCQIMEDGTPNRNQCYQPAELDRLLITRGVPTATIAAQPTFLIFAVGQQRVVFVLNTSNNNADGIGVTLPPGSPISAENNCPASLPPGGFCSFVFSSSAATTETAIIQGSNTNAVPIDITVVGELVIITALPQTVTMPPAATRSVTVRNSLFSTGIATNITVTPPSQSGITVDSSACTNLAIGANCIVEFTSTTPVIGAEFVIQASNSNAVTVTVNVEDPVIELTGVNPADEYITVDGAPLVLEVTNSAESSGDVDNIAVINKASCPDVTPSYSGCATVAPGATCTITLNSATPYVPCTISIAGNTGNTITTTTAFLYEDGLVFEKSGSTAKVAYPTATSNVWTTDIGLVLPNTASTTNGAANSTRIRQNCPSGQCPALDYCYGIASGWYLPAINELASMENILCPNQICSFGIDPGSTWSSTWVYTTPFINRAYARNLSQGTSNTNSVSSSLQTYCIKEAAL